MVVGGYFLLKFERYGWNSRNEKTLIGKIVFYFVKFFGEIAKLLDVMNNDAIYHWWLLVEQLLKNKWCNWNLNEGNDVDTEEYPI